MPASAAEKDKNESLTAYRKLKLKYGGEISDLILRSMVIELRDIVPRGRYTGRNGSKPVCVSSLVYEAGARSVEDVRVVFVNLDRSRGEQRIPVADFLMAYRFFATDCA